jgi:ABC-2 type transport system ATP-binding protein
VAGAPVASFSLGMRRRLMLAETLVHEPALILLDEPTLGLDPDGLDVLVELLQSRAATGASAVIATNDVAFAARVAHRVLLLHRGRVVTHGTPAALLDQLGADAIVDVALSAPARAAIRLPAEARLTAQTNELLTLRMPRGGGVLPALLRAVEESGAAVRAVSIREPDLSDVFRAATGDALA